MVIADLTVILYVSCKILSYQFFYISAASTDDLDPLRLKHIHCTLAHIARQHDAHSHLSQHRSDTALASAALGRSKLGHICNLAVNHIEYGIISTVAEMIVHS